MVSPALRSQRQQQALQGQGQPELQSDSSLASATRHLLILIPRPTSDQDPDQKNAETKGKYRHTRLLQPLCPWAVLMALSQEHVLKATGMRTGAGEWTGKGSCGDSDLLAALLLRVGRISR